MFFPPHWGWRRWWLDSHTSESEKGTDFFFFLNHSEIKSGELDIFTSVSWGQQDGAIPTKDIQENASVYHTSFLRKPLSLCLSPRRKPHAVPPLELSEQVLTSHTLRFPSELLFWYVYCSKNRPQRGGTGDSHPVGHLPRTF